MSTHPQIERSTRSAQHGAAAGESGPVVPPLDRHASNDQQHLSRDGVDLYEGFEFEPQSTPVQLSLSYIERLGRLTLLILVFAPLLQLVVLAFLAFVWSRPTHNFFWISLVTTQWATRSVTIASFIIRLTVDVLTGTAAAMLAALSLESGSIALPSLAAVSILRAVNPAPTKLASVLSKAGRPFMRKGYFPLALILAIITVALQFTSTFLVSDLRIDSIPGFTSTATYNYDLDHGLDISAAIAMVQGRPIYASKLDNDSVNLKRTLASSLHRSWGRPPSSFPLFGEFREDITSPPTVDDTGYLMRSFLPFADTASRANVSNFTGPAFVLDSRVSCQPPVLSGLTLMIDNQTAVTKHFAGYVGGLLSNSTQVADLWFPQTSNGTLPFNCSLEVDPTNAPRKRYAVCQINLDDGVGITGAPQLAFFVDDATKNLSVKTVQLTTETAGSLRSRLTNITVKDNLPSQSPAFLVIATETALQGLPHDQFASANLSVLNMSASTFDASNPPLAPASVNLFFSLCYTSWSSDNGLVEMSTPRRLQEPALGFTAVNNTGATWDTVLGQYYPFAMAGADGHPTGEQRTPSDRGVLEMAPYSVNSSLPFAMPIQVPSLAVALSSFEEFTVFNFLPQVNTEVGPNLIFRTLDNDTGTHVWGNFPFLATYTGLFSAGYDAVDSSFLPFSFYADPSVNNLLLQAVPAYGGSVAWALSTLLSVLSAMSYVDNFPLLGKQGSAQVVRFEAVLTPQSWTGLAVVVVLVGVQMCLVGLVAILFVARTRYSKLGNVWQTVAQVAGPETESILRRATMATDREVGSWLVGNGRERVRIGIGMVEGDANRYGSVKAVGPTPGLQPVRDERSRRRWPRQRKGESQPMVN